MTNQHDPRDPTDTLTVRLAGHTITVSGPLDTSTNQLLLAAIELMRSRGHRKVTLLLDGTARLETAAVHAQATEQRTATRPGLLRRVRADSPAAPTT